MNNCVLGVEIFSTGTWNGHDYSLEDLKEIERSFNETKMGVRPHLKLGHNDDQDLLKKDGLPAAGWVDKVYVVGQKLVADFVDIPKKIYELIQNKAYRKVSVELYVNSKVGEKLYPYVLSAVALLGADNPGCENLNDILAMYKREFANEDEKKIELSFDSAITKKGKLKMEKTEAQIKAELELADKTEKLEFETKKAKELSDKLTAQEKELSELQTFKKEFEVKELKLKAEAEKAKLDKFVSDLAAEKLVTPAMKPLVAELLGEEKQEYSHGDKKVSKNDLVKEILKLSKAVSDVNFEESSEDSEESKVKGQKEKELHEQAIKYSKENKVTYSVALKAVLAQNKK